MVFASIVIVDGSVLNCWYHWVLPLLGVLQAGALTYPIDLVVTPSAKHTELPQGRHQELPQISNPQGTAAQMHHVLKSLQTLNHVPSLHLAMPGIRRWEGATNQLGVKSQWHTARSNSRSKALPSIETASPACALVFPEETTYIKGVHSHSSEKN